MLNRLIKLFSEEPQKTQSSEWNAIKPRDIFFVSILLIMTIVLWSTIKLVFLSAIGYIFTYLAIKYRAEGRNFLVVSVIGLIVSFIILVQFSAPLISEMGKAETPVTEVIEEGENMFERLLSKLDEPEEQKEPTLFEKYTPLIIIFNTINLLLLTLAVFTSQETFVKNAQQFNLRVVHTNMPTSSRNSKESHDE